MVGFILAWLYILITFEVCPFFWDIINDGIFEKPFYFNSVFLFLFSLNYFFSKLKESFNNNKDVLYRFVSLCTRPFAILFTVTFNELKSFFFFLKKFKYKTFIKTSYTYIYSNFKNINVLWKPIFRKWSYFGFYKTNKSKWWKNK